MKKYKVSFTGRKLGAIGIFYQILDTVSVDFQNDKDPFMNARIQLSEKYEHIVDIKFLGEDEK